MAKPRVFVILPAAGLGERMGAGKNKVLLKLGGQFVVERSLRIFQAMEEIAGIQTICRSEELEWMKHMQKEWDITKALTPVVGGASRQDSVFSGLQAITEIATDDDLVLIHDAARCLVTTDIVKRCIKHLEDIGSCVAAVPVKDTIKRISTDGQIKETLLRDELWQIQTPQAFRYKPIFQAYRLADEEGFVATDDASLMEALGQEVRVVEGSYLNIKLTTSEDLLIAEHYLTGPDYSSAASELVLPRENIESDEVSL